MIPSRGVETPDAARKLAGLVTREKNNTEETMTFAHNLCLTERTTHRLKANANQVVS
jgi:hypothetical protein